MLTQQQTSHYTLPLLKSELADSLVTYQYLALVRTTLPFVFSCTVKSSLLDLQAEVAKLDHSFFLPLFFDGIRETQEPYRFLAVKVSDSLYSGLSSPAWTKLCRIVGFILPSFLPRMHDDARHPAGQHRHPARPVGRNYILVSSMAAYPALDESPVALAIEPTSAKCLLCNCICCFQGCFMVSF